MENEEYNQPEITDIPKEDYKEPVKESPFSIVSLVMGILSFPGIFCCYGGFIFGGLAIIFACLTDVGDGIRGKAKAGLVTGIVGLSFSFLIIIGVIAMAFFAEFISNSQYIAEYFHLAAGGVR